MEQRALIGRCPRLGLQPLELLDKPLLLRPDPLLETELSGLVPPGELLLLCGGRFMELELSSASRCSSKRSCAVWMSSCSICGNSANARIRLSRERASSSQ